LGTPGMGIGLWGLSPLCEIGISRRSVYQMTTSREQARGEGNCGRVTDRGKETCEWLGKRRVCRLPSVRHAPLECILTESARPRRKQLRVNLLPRDRNAIGDSTKVTTASRVHDNRGSSTLVEPHCIEGAKADPHLRWCGGCRQQWRRLPDFALNVP